MALLVYSGSAEFIALTMLCVAFNPLAAIGMALMVGARHLFYGISMLDRYQGAGLWRKPLMIFWLTDETFAINYANGGNYSQQLWVSMLDYQYWITGGVMGYLIGSSMGEELMQWFEGLDFVVTAMFVTIFMDDFMRNKGAHMSAWLGIGSATLCLMVFGESQFIIPTMLTILLVRLYHSEPRAAVCIVSIKKEHSSLRSVSRKIPGKCRFWNARCLLPKGCYLPLRQSRSAAVAWHTRMHPPAPVAQ